MSYTLPKHRKAFDVVILFVAQYFDIPAEVIRGESREREVVYVRQVAYYLLKTKYGFSYSTIGKLFDRDHTTVIHGVRKIEQNLDAEEVNSILSTFPQG